MGDQLYQGKVWPKDIEAELTFLPTEKGGRTSPTFSGYRGQFFYDGMDWDAVQFYPDVEQVNPGDTVRVFFSLLFPHKHVGKLVPGKMFLIREGQRVVAYGKVIKVLELEESAQRTRDRGMQVGVNG